MSTPSRSAMSSALRSGRTLNAMMIAFDADAEQDVGLVDRTDAGVDDADLDLLVRQLGERVGQHFGRALHVGLDDDRQFLHAAFGDLRLQRLERESAALGAERAVLRLFLAERRNLARLGGLGAPGRRRRAAAGPSRPSTSTGVDGPADLVGRPRSSMSARTRPTIGPAMNVSPTLTACRPARGRSPPGRGPCPAWLRAPCPTRCASGWPSARGFR